MFAFLLSPKATSVVLLLAKVNHFEWAFFFCSLLSKIIPTKHLTENIQQLVLWKLYKNKLTKWLYGVACGAYIKKPFGCIA